MEPDDLDKEDEMEFWVNIDQIPVQQEDTADTEPSRPRSKTPKAGHSQLGVSSSIRSFLLRVSVPDHVRP